MKTYRHRDLEGVLRAAARRFPVVALSGPRQSGKSTLLRALFEKTHAYVTLDDPSLREQAQSDPRSLLSGPMIVDEVQYAPALLSHVKMWVDRERRPGSFLLTGSQQFPLMRGLGESLAGRVGIFELLPFAVGERKKSLRPGDGLVLFREACLRGLFPEPALAKKGTSESWYASYVQTYLERDVRTLHDIGNLRDFHRFLRLLAARCAQTLNLSACSLELGVAVNTLKRWLSVLEASRLIFLLPPYFRNFGKRITQSPKLYFLDLGLACHLLSLTDPKFLLRGPLAGPLFENFCVQEAVKAHLNRGLRPEFYYLRTHNGLEVDLLVERGGRVHPVEIKLTRTPTPSMGEPMRRLADIFPEMAWSEGRLVTGAAESRRGGGGLHVETVTSFLEWLRFL